MAQKKPVSGPVEPQQEEITFIVVKFKGGSESMQKGFDAVNNAINALGPVNPANHRVIVQRTPAQIPAPSANGTVIDAETEDVEDQQEIEESAQKTAASSNGKPKKPNAPRYTFMNDFNLAPAGAPCLKDYCEEKDPQSENDKFLVAASWVQVHGGVDPFTGTHLFTSFRAIGWKTQADMTKPLRRLKSAKSYFENPSFGKWKITGPGLTAAEKIVKA
jgi:hypothetical protein